MCIRDRLKVLCEKFAHTRFEPSGWTGNEHIGYAKSIMDYIFRWLQLRFLSGQQLSLFTGLGAPAPAPADEETPTLPLSAPETRSGITADQHQPTRGMGASSAPQGGIAPDIHASTSSSATVDPSKVADRGLIHAADAMRTMYDMGDAPSCHTCGAIMVRNGSCYRCMSCGSTSGCS